MTMKTTTNTKTFTCGHIGIIPKHIGKGKKREEQLSNYFNDVCPACAIQSLIDMPRVGVKYTANIGTKPLTHTTHHLDKYNEYMDYVAIRLQAISSEYHQAVDHSKFTDAQQTQLKHYLKTLNSLFADENKGWQGPIVTVPIEQIRQQFNSFMTHKYGYVSARGYDLTIEGEEIKDITFMPNGNIRYSTFSKKYSRNDGNFCVDGNEKHSLPMLQEHPIPEANPLIYHTNYGLKVNLITGRIDPIGALK